MIIIFYASSWKVINVRNNLFVCISSTACLYPSTTFSLFSRRRNYIMLIKPKRIFGLVACARFCALTVPILIAKRRNIFKGGGRRRRIVEINCKKNGRGNVEVWALIYEQKCAFKLLLVSPSFSYVSWWNNRRRSIMKQNSDTEQIHNAHAFISLFYLQLFLYRCERTNNKILWDFIFIFLMQYLFFIRVWLLLRLLLDISCGI